MSEDLAYLTATELVTRYAAGDLSPVEVTEACLGRIEAHDGKLNAFIIVDRDGALASARRSETRWAKGEPMGLLDGVPTGIKDIVLTKGWPTLRGSKTVDADQPWSEDAPVVARLREHGAVFLGKTTTPEFGWKGVTDSPLTGTTRNPWNLEKTPGGSSGGAAAALAAGMGAIHVGTDGGGSIRIPSGFTGVFGIKATFGRVPAYPASPFGTVAHVGPMTRSVEDAALALTVIAQPDPRDWLALPYDGRDWRMGLEDGVSGLKVAYSADLGYAKVDPEVARIAADAAAVFADLGAAIEARDPGFADPTGIFSTHWWASAAFAFKDLNEDKRALMDPGLLDVIARGQAIGTLDYLTAVQARAALGSHMNLFHEGCDLLLTPALAVPAFDVDKLAPDEARTEEWVSWTPFTYPFNLTQQPACSIPCGFTEAGLPVGLQIVGPRYREDLVLRAARAFEAAHPWQDRRPTL